MDKPDKIWAEAGSYPDFCDNDWSYASASADCELGALYLLATPERELASELVEALKQIASFETLMPDGEKPVVTPEAALARAVLAKLEGKKDGAQ